MRGFNHATILSPSFHGLHKERLAQWPAFCDPKNEPKILGGTSRKIGWGVQHASWNPYPISDQKLWFSLPYFRPDQKCNTLFQTWSPGAWRVTGVHDKLLRQVCVAGVKRGRGRENLGTRERVERAREIRKGTPARTPLFSPFFTLRFWAWK